MRQKSRVNCNFRVSPGFLAAVALACLFLSACGAATRENASRFHDFSVTTAKTEKSENAPTTLEIRHNNAPVVKPADPYRVITPNPAQANFPLPGCETRNIAVFTGGANCCFGYYIMTACARGDSLAVLEPFDGGMGLAEGAKMFTVNDPAFMYYTKGEGAGALSLIRVQSPRPERLLLFENDAWRADKIGEFPKRYQELARNVAADSTMFPPSRAMLAAYYSLMAGENANQAGAAFKKSLPREYARVADAVFADIQKAARGFNPVRMLKLP